MNPENFAMQYQFVNSLASCYPQSQLGQHGGTNASTNSTTSSANNQGASNSDYFPTPAYTPNLYPNAPQSHYANQYNLAAQQNPTDMVDYTQLQPQSQRLMLPNQQQQTSMNPNSCKYDPDGVKVTNPNNNNNNNAPLISSPQDLSTARDISPKLSPSVAENMNRPLNKNITSGSGGGGGSVTSTNQNNPLGLNNNNNNNNVNHTNVPLSMHSPSGADSDTDSESGNEAGGSQNGSGKKGTPPQIYPWMKRVHIGTSELHFYFHLLYSKKSRKR